MLRRLNFVPETEFSISPSRLSAKGDGLDRPIAGNATQPGRSKNRRVQFAKVDYLITMIGCRLCPEDTYSDSRGIMNSNVAGQRRMTDRDSRQIDPPVSFQRGGPMRVTVLVTVILLFAAGCGSDFREALSSGIPLPRPASEPNSI